MCKKNEALWAEQRAAAFRKAGPDDKIARRVQAERRVKTGFLDHHGNADGRACARIQQR